MPFLCLQIGFAALLGAVLGGLGVSDFKVKKLKGLLKLVKNKNYLSQKEIKVAIAFIYVQYSVLDEIIAHFYYTW